MLKKFLFIILFSILYCFTGDACTSAIIGADVNPYGRPLLWKNRDTSTIDNKIEYIGRTKDHPAYVALFNASDTLLSEAWMGMNEYGFAIMNTASYNIKDDDIAEKDMDKEGLIMTLALQNCKTVNDFACLLETLPRPMGIEANFGVIDAYGDGAFFETNNHSYVRYNLNDDSRHVLIRTNYSHSGRPEEGYGFIREANAKKILDSYIDEKNVTSELLTEKVSRSFWHDLLGKDFAESGENWVIDQDFIPRYKSTATIVIEGIEPLRAGEEIVPDDIINQYVMWSGLGYPPCSEIYPVFCREDGVAECLRGLNHDGHSSQSDIVKRRRDEVFPFKKGNGEKYIDMKKLINDEGSGYIQTLVPKNLETYKKTREQISPKVN